MEIMTRSHTAGECPCVLLSHVAEFYSRNRSSFRKWVLKQGIRLQKVKAYDQQGALQDMLVVRLSDLPRIGELRGKTMEVEDRWWWNDEVVGGGK